MRITGQAGMNAPRKVHADVKSVTFTRFQTQSDKRLASITDVGREEWDALFPGRVENWDYFDACARATRDSSTVSAIAVYSGRMLVAAAPVFRTSYQLDMAIPEQLKSCSSLLKRFAPALLKKSVICVGSPLTEECPIGLRPSLDVSERQAAFATLVEGMEQHADANDICIRAFKDVEDRDAVWMKPILARRGYACVPNLPVATLHLPFKSEDEYLQSLSSNMRRSLKRKMRDRGKVEVELCNSISGIEDEINALFLETKTKSKADYAGFDDVPADYFSKVVESLGDKALIVLTRVDGQLASFSLSLLEGDRVIGKYLGMRYPLANEHDIYFVNWMTIVRFCIERRISWMQTGQTTYKLKARLGCQLKRSWIFFKHRGLIMAPLVRAIGGRMRFDTLDPDLAEGSPDLPYLVPRITSP